jgi:hypothetical protein
MMMPLSSLLRAAALCLLAPLAVACVVQTEPHRGPTGSSSAGGPVPVPSGTGAPGSGSNGAPSATPILVDVDTNKTMNAQPGQGVGVFTEYTAGGHWHVWWTCDTSVNPQQTTCLFDVKISVASGVITNVKSEHFDAATDALMPTDKQLVARTSTTTNVSGLLFDTDPGAVITLDAAMGGAHDGGFLFFVQDDKVNGGYTGALTDPLMLEGSTP